MVASKTTTAAENAAGTPDRAEQRGFLRFISIILMFAGAIFAGIAAIVFLIPDKNDYNQGTALKHQRLSGITTRKIVFIGGSNLAYGLDSKMVQQITGCPAVNMGMNGWFGVRYMLEEVKAHINPSDVVVLSFEHDNIYKSVEGAAATHMAIIRAYPKVFTYLTLEQKIDALRSLPIIAHTKMMRLLSLSLIRSKEIITGRSYEVEPIVDMDKIESIKAMTPEGDIIGHLGVEWPYRFEDAVVPENPKIDPHLVPLMRDFAEEMRGRGVPVIVSYTPVVDRVYERIQGDLVQLHALIKSSPPLIAPSPPGAFAYPKSNFFDTVYHLNKAGRGARTEKVVDDLISTLRDRVRCQ